MADPTPSDLLGSPSRDDVAAALLASLARSEFPITDWESGGVVRTLVELEAEVLEDLIASAVPQIFDEGFVGTSDGDWLATIAHGLYGIDKKLATVAQQTVTLACAGTSGPYPLVSGGMFFLATDGKRYVLASSGTVPSGGTLSVTVQAEGPGAATGLVNRIDTPILAGLTVSAATTAIVGGVPQFGSNDESDDSLTSRCNARLPDLSVVGTDDRLAKWAKAGSTEVTRVRIDADPVNPGGAIVTLAGPGGGVTGGAVTAVQGYIDARLAVTDWVTAQTATNRTITASGTVTVPGSKLAEIQVAADDAWIDYLTGSQIGGSVYVAKLVQVVMDAGAIDITGEALTGGTPDVALASTEVPVPNGSGLASLLTWVTV